VITEQEIRQQLDALAADKISVSEFGDWLCWRCWNLHDVDSPETIALATYALRVFAEYERGLNEQQVREALLKQR
jgi:hypothetical protein